MKELHVDVAVIGAGTAGLTAFRAARGAGRVVLIEGGHYGTTCARVGCMPSKLLIAAADSAHMVGQAAAFGVHPGQVRIDGAAVMARVRSERDRFVGFVLDGVDRIDAQDRLRGQARFTGPNTLAVQGHGTVHAKSIVIATGSRPSLPDSLRGAGSRVITSDEVFELPTLPASVAVIGSGTIGLELGQALARLGVAVTLFARGRGLADLTDPDVLRSATAALGAELDMRPGHEIVQARQEGGHVLLATRDPNGRAGEGRYDYVLAAAGRIPNVDGLGLEHAGLELDERGIPRSDPRTGQCGRSSVFIAGDASGGRALLHEASDQGRIAGENAARFPDVHPGLRRAPLSVTFTDPNIATLGHRYRDLCAGKRERFAVGAVSFEDQGRSRVMLANRGMLRVYGEFGTGRFLGAEMAAPRGEHLAHLLAWAFQARMTVRQMLEMPFYHPVIEEGLRTALRELSANIDKGEPAEPKLPDCTPGI